MKEKDINVKISDVLLNIRAVAIIEKDGKILFQKRKQDEFWALPGGKVRIGEKSIDTIKRELKEELNIENFDIKRCNSVSEYFFTFDNTDIHQYIFSYIVNVENNEWICSRNGEFDGIEKTENLVFKWFNTHELSNAPIKPDFLKEQIDKINDNEVLFTVYIEK